MALGFGLVLASSVQTIASDDCSKLETTSKSPQLVRQNGAVAPDWARQLLEVVPGAESAPVAVNDPTDGASQQHKTLTSNLSPSQMLSHAKRLGGTELLEKWDRIAEVLRSGVPSQTPESPVRKAWADWAVSLSSLPELVRLSAIHQRVIEGILYTADIDSTGLPDYWETPCEVAESQTADCEGLVVWEYFLALKAGIPAERLFAVVGSLGNQEHMVLLVSRDPSTNGTDIVLDSVNRDPLRGTYLDGFKPLFYLGLNDIWLHRAS